jgi:hypothetical protein
MLVLVRHRVEMHNFKECYQRFVNIQNIQMDIFEVDRIYDIQNLWLEIGYLDKQLSDYKKKHKNATDLVQQIQERTKPITQLLEQYEQYKKVVDPLEVRIEDEKSIVHMIMMNQFKHTSQKGETLIDKPLFDVIRCSSCYVGFVDLTTSTKQCISCGKEHCRSCWKLCNNNHVCCKDDTATVEEQKKHTQCPVCRLCIERSEGCDTMYCIHCHTGFTFQGEILNPDHVVLNPHFFEDSVHTQNFHYTGFTLTMDHFILKQPRFYVLSTVHKAYRMRAYLIDVLQYEMLDDMAFQVHSLPGVHPIHVILHNLYRHIHGIEMGLEELYDNLCAGACIRKTLAQLAKIIGFVEHVCQSQSGKESTTALGYTTTTRSILKMFFNSRMSIKYGYEESDDF